MTPKPSAADNTGQRRRAKGWRGIRGDVRFVIVFALLAIGCNALVSALTARGGFPPLEGFWARVTAALASTIGIASEVAGRRITIGASPLGGLEIIFPCTAVLELLIFAAGVTAFPASRRARAVGYLCAVVVVFALNCLRLVSLAWMSVHAPKRYHVAHDIWMQGFLIVCILPAWIAWALWARREAARRAERGSADSTHAPTRSDGIGGDAAGGHA